LMASYPLARASVITINRVQDVAMNLVSKDPMSADGLLEMWTRGMILDTDRYIGRSYRSIHIADASFKTRSNGTNVHSDQSDSMA